MGLVHTPRTIASICKGLLNRRRDPTEGLRVMGIGEANRHVYHARLGLFDVDYLGHMNNASYLTHAELARWELTAYNGMLQAMFKSNVNYLVVGTTIRYRKEIRPIFRRFQIDTTVCGMDDRNMYISHKFRLAKSGPESRVMAQMLVQGVAIQGRTVINPGDFLKKEVGLDEAVVDSVRLPSCTGANNDNELDEMLERYVALEESMKKLAAKDDERLTT